MQEILKFKPEFGTSFRVIEKSSGKEMRRCVADAFFVFHHANAFEEDGKSRSCHAPEGGLALPVDGSLKLKAKNPVDNH